MALAGLSIARSLIEANLVEEVWKRFDSLAQDNSCLFKTVTGLLDKGELVACIPIPYI